MDFRKVCNPINILLASNSPIKIAAAREAAELVSTRINIAPFDSGGSFNKFCNIPENPRGKQEVESCSKKRIQAMYNNSFADSLKSEQNKANIDIILNDNSSIYLTVKPLGVIQSFSSTIGSKTSRTYKFGGKYDYVFAIESGVIMPDFEKDLVSEITYISFVSSNNNIIFEHSLSYKEQHVSVHTTKSFSYSKEITDILLNNPDFTSTQAVEAFLGEKLDKKDPLFPVFGISRKDVIKDKLVEIFKELGL